MNITPYHSPDAVLTEALVSESTARAANLKSMTARNVLFGSAALAGALLIGWAAITWAENQRLDPKLLQEALAKMPELRVAPVQIADGSKVGVVGDVGIKPDAMVGVRPGGEVSIAEGATVGVHGTVGIDPDATVTVAGSVRPGSTMPDMSRQPTKTDEGEAIKREVVVFTEIPWRGGMVVSGWRFSNGASKRPYAQYCYHSSPTSDTAPTENVVYLVRDGVDYPVSLPRAAEARTKCVWWRG